MSSARVVASASAVGAEQCSYEIRVRVGSARHAASRLCLILPLQAEDAADHPFASTGCWSPAARAGISAPIAALACSGRRPNWAASCWTAAPFLAPLLNRGCPCWRHDEYGSRVRSSAVAPSYNIMPGAARRHCGDGANRAHAEPAVPPVDRSADSRADRNGMRSAFSQNSEVRR